MRPPGNTQRSGMKLWPPWRLPISTRGFTASRRKIITVAAFLGRTARAPGTRGGPSGLRNWLSASLIKQLYDPPYAEGKGAAAEGGLAAGSTLLAGADVLGPALRSALGAAEACAAAPSWSIGPPVAPRPHSPPGPGRGRVRGRRFAQHLEDEPAGDRRRLGQLHLHRHAHRPARPGPLAPQGVRPVVMDEV